MSSRRSTLDIILNFLKTGQGADQAAAEFDNLDTAQTKATGSAKGFDIAELAVADRVLAVGRAILGQVVPLIELGIGYERAQTALVAYAGSTEEATAITDAIGDATDGALSKFDATTTATRLLSLGLANTAAEAARFTKIASTLGATMGNDVNTSVEEFGLLLANQSILRLDTFGVSGSKVRQIMADLAAEFPAMDREARFLNATFQVADERVSQLGKAGFEATSSLDRMNAMIDNAKLAAGQFLAEGLLPIIDGIIGLVDASKEQVKAVFDTSASWEEYQDKMNEGKAVVRATARAMALGTEEQFNQAKAMERARIAIDGWAAASANATDVQQELIVTEQVLNDAITEQDKLLSALSAGLSGKIGKSYDSWLESVENVEQGQIDLNNETEKLFDQLVDGEITVDEFNTAFGRLADKQDDLIEKSEGVRTAMQRATREMIFQQAAADLSAEASLLLARSLGLIDEASFAVAQESQKLRANYDLTGQSAEDFAQAAADLAADVDSLQSKNIEITAETLAAERALRDLKEAAEDIPKVIEIVAIVRELAEDQRKFNNSFAGDPGLAGALFDQNIFSGFGDQGVGAPSTPSPSSTPAANNGGGGISIGKIELSDGVGLAMFMDQLERMR